MTLPQKIFVINLLNRPERLEQFQSRVAKFGLEVEPYRAISGDICNPPDSWKAGNGAWGCYKSHLNILEHCLNNRIGSYLVFEDDAQFKPTFLEVLESTLLNAPEDWDQIYFGGQLLHAHSRPPIRVNQFIYRPFNVNRTHCFALSRKGMEKVYQHISDLPFYPKEHIDHHLGRWHEDFENKVYCPPHWVVGQHGSSSSVSGKHEPVTFYEDPIKYARDHELYRHPVCVLYQGPKRLIPELAEILHFGNSVSTDGYDVLLQEASKYAYPGPKISEWYNWVRTECVIEKGTRIPAAFHPFLEKDHLEKAGVREVIEIRDVSTIEEVKALLP